MDVYVQIDMHVDMKQIDMDTDVHIDMMQMYIDKPCKVSMAFLFEKEKISE